MSNPDSTRFEQAARVMKALAKLDEKRNAKAVKLELWYDAERLAILDGTADDVRGMVLAERGES